MGIVGSYEVYLIIIFINNNLAGNKMIESKKQKVIEISKSELDKQIAFQAQKNGAVIFDSSLIQGSDKGFISPVIDEDRIDQRTETLQKLQGYQKSK